MISKSPKSPILTREQNNNKKLRPSRYDISYRSNIVNTSKDKTLKKISVGKVITLGSPMKYKL